MSTNTDSSHTEASPARADLSRRAILRGAPSVAALAVAAAVPAVAFAAADPDAELRRLWHEYLRLETVISELAGPKNLAYGRYYVERPEITTFEGSLDEWRALGDQLYAKHNVAAFYGPWEAACEEQGCLVEAMRAAHAKGLVGIGVKLAAISGVDNESRESQEDAIASALADIDRLTGIDFAGQAERAGGANV